MPPTTPKQGIWFFGTGPPQVQSVVGRHDVFAKPTPLARSVFFDAQSATPVVLMLQQRLELGNPAKNEGMPEKILLDDLAAPCDYLLSKFEPLKFLPFLDVLPGPARATGVQSCLSRTRGFFFQ